MAIHTESRELFRFEGFTLDVTRGCVRSGERELELRPKSFEVLRFLVQNADRLVSKDELMTAIWPDVFVTEDSLSRCISDVRIALGDAQQRIIKTVPRRGYLFGVPVSSREEASGRRARLSCWTEPLSQSCRWRTSAATRRRNI